MKPPRSLALLARARPPWPRGAAATDHVLRRLPRRRRALGRGSAQRIVERLRRTMSTPRSGCPARTATAATPIPAWPRTPRRAMDPGFKANPFRGAPERQATSRCSARRCHSDPVYMKRFNPGARVDQEREYWTSQHGQALKRGDDEGGHLHRLPRRPRHPATLATRESPVYPTQVAETCRALSRRRRAHGRAAQPLDGRPLPLDQYAALAPERPRRGAARPRGTSPRPPATTATATTGRRRRGWSRSASVCGQCHGREAQLFRASPKHAGFEGHTELHGGGRRRRAAPPATTRPGIAQARARGRQLLASASPATATTASCAPRWRCSLPCRATPCAFCHEGPEGLAQAVGEPEAEAPAPTRRPATACSRRRRGEKLEGPRSSTGWWTWRSRCLTHTRAPAEGRRARAAARVRAPVLQVPDRQDLLQPTMIPMTGRRARTEVVRCNRLPRRGGAERRLRRPRARCWLAWASSRRSRPGPSASCSRPVAEGSRRGEALLDLDHAVDAQIELEVLVHTFSSAYGLRLREQARGGGRSRAGGPGGRTAGASGAGQPPPRTHRVAPLHRARARGPGLEDPRARSRRTRLVSAG